MQQGTDLLTQLAAIRERQGKEPLPNPGYIQGFGENDPPSPPPPPLYAPPAPDDDDPSPLIPPQQYYVKKKEPEAPALSEEVVIPQFKLLVMDSAAQYAGHAVVLEDWERDEIAKLVVQAVKRELDAQASQLQVKGTAFTGAETVSPEKRKRGRPRKNAPVA